MKRENFYFTKKERIGFLGLVLLAGTLLVGSFAIRTFIEPKEYTLTLPEMLITEEEEVPSFTASEKNYNKFRDSKSTKNTDHKHNAKKERLFFQFNPNSLSHDSLLLLGLSKYAVNNLVKYREKGGKIRNAEKFMNIYGIQEADSVLIPFLEFDETQIHFSEKAGERQQKSSEIQVKTMHFVNINTADTLEMQLLSGIGPYYARTIYYYRERLGGFLYEEQLYEITRLKQETIEKILPYLIFDVSAIQKLKINEIEVKELGRHPYISFPQAKVVINYRNNHGPFASAADLKNAKVLSDKEIAMLEPYLDFGYDLLVENGNDK
jgi:competence protein ComEA